MWNPEEDGITHINVYSKGKTELGQFLSNFTYTPFKHPQDGTFNSIEGYWYWLSTKDDKLRKLSGYSAKKYGREINGTEWLQGIEFQNKIREAIILKIETNPEMKEDFIQSALPFAHYYVYGDKVVEPKEGKWILESLTSWREMLGHQRGIFHAKEVKGDVTIYVPVFQKNPDGTGDDFPGYPNFTWSYADATQDEQMAWNFEPDYVLELKGNYNFKTKPFRKVKNDS